MEKELIVRAKAGDKNAFSDLVRIYLKRAYRAAYVWLRDIEEATDLCQEAFFRAYRSISSFDQDRPFYPWVYTILKNLYVNKVRHESLVTLQATDMERVPGNSRTPEEHLMRSESVRYLMKALSELSERDREILVLKHWNECSYEEISQILSIPKGTVMSRLYYARVRLREKIIELEGVAT